MDLMVFTQTRKIRALGFGGPEFKGRREDRLLLILMHNEAAVQYLSFILISQWLSYSFPEWCGKVSIHNNDQEVSRQLDKSEILDTLSD